MSVRRSERESAHLLIRVSSAAGLLCHVCNCQRNDAPAFHECPQPLGCANRCPLIVMRAEIVASHLICEQGGWGSGSTPPSAGNRRAGGCVRIRGAGGGWPSRITGSWRAARQQAKMSPLVISTPPLVGGVGEGPAASAAERSVCRCVQRRSFRRPTPPAPHLGPPPQGGKGARLDAGACRKVGPLRHAAALRRRATSPCRGGFAATHPERAQRDSWVDGGRLSR